MDSDTMFGKTVRQFRRTRGWTQERLAEETELTARTISGIETGSRAAGLNARRRIAEVLGFELLPPREGDSERPGEAQAGTQDDIVIVDNGHTLLAVMCDRHERGFVTDDAEDETDADLITQLLGVIEIADFADFADPSAEELYGYGRNFTPILSSLRERGWTVLVRKGIGHCLSRDEPIEGWKTAIIEVRKADPIVLERIKDGLTDWIQQTAAS